MQKSRQHALILNFTFDRNTTLLANRKRFAFACLLKQYYAGYQSNHNISELSYQCDISVKAWELMIKLTYIRGTND